MTDEGHRNFNFECHEAAHRSQADHRLRGKKNWSRFEPIYSSLQDVCFDPIKLDMSGAADGSFRCPTFYTRKVCERAMARSFGDRSACNGLGGGPEEFYSRLSFN